MAQSPDMEGLNKLKDSSLWFTIVTLITAIGIFYSQAAILTIVAIVLLIIKAIPSLRDTFNFFKSNGKDVDRGLQGLNYILWGYIILFIAGIFGLLSFISIFSLNPAIVGFFGAITALLIIVGVLIIFISYLFIGLSVYNLGVFYNNDFMKIGGILIIIPVINFIGWILTYVGSDDTIRKIQGIQPFNFPAYQPIYQVGNGILRLDGTCFFSLYSPIQGVQITSAILQELNFSATDIQPNILIQGVNNISIKFQILGSGIVGKLYTVVVTLSNGQVIPVKVALTGT